MFAQSIKPLWRWNFLNPVRNNMSVRFRVLIDGEATATLKTVRLTKGPAVSDRGTSLLTTAYEYTPWLNLYDRTWLGRESWLVILEDLSAEPPIYKGVLLPITAAGTYTINVWTGAGGGVGGDDGLLSAVLRVDGQADARDVVALERTSEGEWRVAGYTRTVEGEGALDLKVLGGQVYGVAVDDYGIAFLPGLAVSIGQRIRPTQFRGWMYDVTEAGALPISEPSWWPMEGDNAPRVAGTARLQAARYYRPLAHGPVPVETT